MTEITIEVLNGVVMDVYSSDPETFVTVLDYDLAGKRVHGSSDINRMQFIESKHRVGINGMDIISASRKKMEVLPI
jgi:hypothetical protein